MDVIVKRVVVIFCVILYLFCSLFISERLTYLLVDNKVYDSCDFSNYKIQETSQEDIVSFSIETNNLTKFHLFYKDLGNLSKISVRFADLENLSYTLDSFSYDDNISYVEVVFNPPLKKKNGFQLSFSVFSNDKVLLLTDSSENNKLFLKQYGFSYKISFLIFVVLFIFCIGFACFTFFLVKHNIQPHKLYLIFAVILGGINLLVSTPLGQSDAITHYESIYNFSNKILGIDSPDGYIMKRRCDLEFLPGYYDDNMNVVRHTWLGTMKSFYIYTASHFSMSPDCTLVPVKKYTTVSPRLEYFPQALFMTLGRILRLNQFFVYFLVVLGNYVLMMVIISLAIKYAKDNYLLFLLLGLHPSVLMSIQSVTYDAIVYSLSLLVISLACYNFTTEIVSKKFKVCCCIPAILLAPMKTVYFPISILLLLSIYNKRLEKLKDRKVYKYILITGLFLFILLISLFAIKYNGNNTVYSISYILNHPLKSFMTFLRTAVSGAQWYDYRLSIMFTNSFILNALLVYVLLCEVKNELTPKQQILLFITYLLIFIFIFCVGFVWTATGERLIWGIQNRYFAPIAPLLFICFQHLNIGRITVNRKISMGIIFITCFVILMMRIRF